MAATLFWMDMIRNRIASYPYKNDIEKKLIKDFMAPIVLMGKESERDLGKSLKQALRETKKECGEASKALIKELKALEKSSIVYSKKATCIFCGKPLNKHDKDCKVKPCDL
jgi:Sec-independent protein translocase protein TatA